MYPARQNEIERAEPMGNDSTVEPANPPMPTRSASKGSGAVPPARDGLSVLSMAGGVPILSRLPRLMRLQPVSIVGAILQDHVPLTIGEALDVAEGNGHFRQSLANLMLGLRVGEGEPGRCIVVTSAERGQGGTLTTLALANHVAAMGCRVLAVECDLQQPVFARALSIPGKAGLLDVLSGAISVRDAVVSTGNAKLDVLMAGGSSAKAADQLAGKNLAQLLSVFRSYDVVLIDAPLPSRQGRYFTGIDSVLICMKDDGDLNERAASAVAAVKALGASNVAIAATMADSVRGTTRQLPASRAEISARAV
jgi:hypothetical protein